MIRTAQAAGGLLALRVAGTAPAAAVRGEARTEAQAYQIRAWRGSTPQAPVLLPRRRIVQYLGLNAFEPVTGEDGGFKSSGDEPSTRGATRLVKEVRVPFRTAP